MIDDGRRTRPTAAGTVRVAWAGGIGVLAVVGGTAAGLVFLLSSVSAPRDGMLLDAMSCLWAVGVACCAVAAWRSPDLTATVAFGLTAVVLAVFLAVLSVDPLFGMSTEYLGIYVLMAAPFVSVLALTALIADAAGQPPAPMRGRR